MCTNLIENCVGDNQTLPWAGNTSKDYCYEGHIGALCESCDLFSTYNLDSWASAQAYTCGKCKDITGSNIAKLFAMNIWVIFSMFISVKSTITIVQN